VGKPAPRPTAPERMNVVLITVDTVVAKRTGLYGAERRTTPELGRFAFSAATFERAYTAGGWTSLAITSLLRGVYPRRLRWTRVFEDKQMNLVRAPEAASKTIRLMFALPIEDTHPTLAAWLQRRGVRTAAVVADGQSEFLDPGIGTAQGFDEFIDMDTRSPLGDDAITSDAAIEVLQGMRTPDERPFFLWVHYFGPHSPNTIHDGTPLFGDRVEDGYDHELAYFDHHVARLISEVRKTVAEGRKIAVLLCSDHGELFGKLNRIHGSDVREQLIRVPMVLWTPGMPRGRYRGLASTVDVMPTVLALTGTPPPPGLDGDDLRRVMADDPALAHRILISETWRFTSRGKLDRDQVAAFDGERKLTWNLLDENKSLRAQLPEGQDGEDQIGEVDATDLREKIETYLEETGLDLND
jgi:arylsulfatase A-like enzyme